MYHFNNIKKYKNLFIAKEIQAKVKHLTRRSLTLRLQIYHIFNYEKILSKPVLTNPISIPIFDLLSLNFSNDDDHIIIIIIIIQGFWYFTWSQSREIQVNPRNSQKHEKYRKIR